MRLATILMVALALFAMGHCQTKKEEEDGGVLECVLAEDTSGCLRTRLAKNVDQIEMEVTGRKGDPPMSAVLEQTGSFIAEVVDDIQNPEDTNEEQQEEGRGAEEARRKKHGKRKKKHLQKLIGLAMLFKAKLGLLLQLISTHLQLKFFVIAIINLVMNATRFWLELKKSHPQKVIYYEHAQHQHHYDHEDHDHGYWGRSSDDPQELAYSAYTPQS